MSELSASQVEELTGLSLNWLLDQAELIYGFKFEDTRQDAYDNLLCDCGKGKLLVKPFKGRSLSVISVTDSLMGAIGRYSYACETTDRTLRSDDYENDSDVKMLNALGLTPQNLVFSQGIDVLKVELFLNLVWVSSWITSEDEI